jgi:hypothetical protein
MHYARHAAFATISVLALACAPAQAEPMKELAVYKSSLGKFNCDVKDLGSGKAFKGIVDKTVEFDGNTYVERYSEVANADHPSAWKSIFIMSYDPQANRWVRNGVDNNGDRNAASSTGWQGDTWVWENDGVNIVVTRQGAKAFTFDVDVKEAAGVKRVAHAECKRV